MVLVMTQKRVTGGGAGRIHVYLQLTQGVVQQELTQPCRAITL